MTLGEQLDELRYNVLRDRSDLVAGDDDSLWSDATLLNYIKDAERRFARQSLILRDSTTPEVTLVKLKEGVQQYQLHPSILSVISAQYTDPGTQKPYDLQRSGHALIAQAAPVEVVFFDPLNPYSAQLPPGAPLAYFTDETLVYGRQSRVTINFYPVPSDVQDGQNVAMRVIRLPMAGYTVNDLDRPSELPEDYHLDVLEWAAYRAQRTFDADAGAPTSSDAHKAAFDDAVKQAQREAKRKMYVGTSLAYGANGFSW
jgi:hypothetical protein